MRRAGAIASPKLPDKVTRISIPIKIAPLLPVSAYTPMKPPAANVAIKARCLNEREFPCRHVVKITIQNAAIDTS